ncbi:hypothetical protein ACTQ9L_01150 [Deinococcus wulumuqiensis]
MKLKMSDILIVLGYASIAYSAYRYATASDGDSKRDALFVGHWAPTFFILGVGAENREYRKQNTLALDADA